MTKLLFWVLLAVVGLVALTLWRAARQEARAEAAYPPSGQFVDVDGTRVHYQIMGGGPDLVLIHGASGNLRDMNFRLMQALAADYRVIAFDRPGLGYTERVNPSGDSLMVQAALLNDASVALGIEKPLVFGQSYGGAVALAWAVLAPDNVSGLILAGAPSYPWDGPPPLLHRVNAHPILGPLVRPFLTAWVPQSYVNRAIAEVFLPQDEPEGYADHIGAPLTLRRVSLRENALQRVNLKAEIAALAPRYDTLSLPIELIHGSADTTVSLTIHSERLARQLPNAHLNVLEGIGHMPHHVRQGATIEAIHRAAERAGLR